MDTITQYKELVKEVTSLNNEVRSYDNVKDPDIPVLIHLEELRDALVAAKRQLRVFLAGNDVPRINFNSCDDPKERLNQRTDCLKKPAHNRMTS